jgi:hypothetical protein
VCFLWYGSFGFISFLLLPVKRKKKQKGNDALPVDLNVYFYSYTTWMHVM